MRDGDSPRIFSVSELSSQLKETVETAFPTVWVSGEMTNITTPRSGHVYFTLKDADAQLRAVIWRTAANRLRFELTDGMEVVCSGGVDVYPPRGSYQLVVRTMEPRGLGAQQLALRKLHAKLAAEGLFDAARKRPLPGLPRRVVVVTSPSGAAIRDFCQVAGRRWRGSEIAVIPARVQGTGAAGEIAMAIGEANRLRPPPDVLVVGRGGGSAEDLGAFNDESVVRAIFASHIPVVSAVGHEIDVTLSDLAADVRALTPSEAAELVVPSQQDLRERMLRQRQRLSGLLRASAGAARARLAAMAHRRVFRRPLERIRSEARRLDELEDRMTRGIENRRRDALRRVAASADRLQSLNPLAVLARGYSVTERMPDRRIVTGSDQLTVGDQLVTRLARGTVISRVEEVKSEEVREPPQENQV